MRLRIKHHGWNHETTTPTCGCYQTELHEGYQTHGLSLNREPVFASSLADVTEGHLIPHSGGLLESITPTRAYYLEFTSDSLEGHRVDLNETETDNQRFAIDWDSLHNTISEEQINGDALGTNFVVREHWTLSDAYPSEQLQASTDPIEADQIQFFNGESFDSVFVLGDENESFWVANDDTTLASHDAQIIAPGVGYFIKRPAGQSTTSLLIVGHVREGAFIQPLTKGHNLIASPRSVSMHAIERGLSIANGFLGSRDPESADRIQTWLGDANPGTQGYDSLFLLDAGQQDRRYWTTTSDASLKDHSESPIFAHDRAVFIQLTSEGHSSYRVPAPHQP